jgi:hypothetical protein
VRLLGCAVQTLTLLSSPERGGSTAAGLVFRESKEQMLWCPYAKVNLEKLHDTLSDQ